MATRLAGLVELSTSSPAHLTRVALHDTLNRNGCEITCRPRCRRIHQTASHPRRNVGQRGREPARRWQACPLQSSQWQRGAVGGHGRALGKVFWGGPPEAPRHAGGGGSRKQREAQRAVAVRRYVPNFLSIKARQIETWTEDHLDARQLLPVLLRRLVHSTGHDLRQVDFPGYDNAERKGSDGIIESDAPTAWIPDGKSFWEFGVNKNPQVKAEKDYAARVASVPAAERAQSTFVFVTPRNWPGKEAWLKQKNALNEWKAVRVLDASDLEQWLEESIPAQIWLAEKLGMPTAGYETLDHCWERWAAGSEPRMTARNICTVDRSSHEGIQGMACEGQ